MKFKIGDEVIAIKPCDFVASFVGRKGVVNNIFPQERLEVSVSFEKTETNSKTDWCCEESSLDFTEKKEGNQYIFDFK